MNPLVRRTFLKLTKRWWRVAAAVFGFGKIQARLTRNWAHPDEKDWPRAKRETAVQPAPIALVSCGVIIYNQLETRKKKNVHSAGGSRRRGVSDSSHQSAGTLCPKGASLQQDILNEAAALVEAASARPGGKQGLEKIISWDSALDENWPAAAVNETNPDQGPSSRRTKTRRPQSIGWNPLPGGGCQHTNEYSTTSSSKPCAALGGFSCILEKFMGPTGLNPRGPPTVSKFGDQRIGRGAMTMGGVDIKNTGHDMMLIMGRANPAGKNHPCGFNGPSKAEAKGGTRQTRK